MTFDEKIKLQAGFPAVYMFAFSLLALGIPVFLVYNSFQSTLDWLWSGVFSVFALIVLLRIYQEQAKQRKFFLLLDRNATLSLIKTRSGADNRYPIHSSSFTLQSRKLVFARLNLDDGTKRFLIFHGLRNNSDAFRRFKVRLKWGELV